MNTLLSRRETFLLHLTLFVIAGWAFYTCLLMPYKTKISVLKTEITLETRKRVQYQNALSQKDTLQKQLGLLGNISPSSSSDEVDNSLLLKAIEGLHQNHRDIQISSINPMAPEKIDSFKRLTLKVEMKMTMESLVKFIHDLNSSNEKLCLTSLRLLPDNDAHEMLNASLIITQLLSLTNAKGTDT